VRKSDDFDRPDKAYTLLTLEHEKTIFVTRTLVIGLQCYAARLALISQ